MTPMLVEYFEALEKMRHELGNPRLLLLMQVGSFYEAYEIDEPVPRGCGRLVADVLRIHLTLKNNKNLPGENNPWMVGFPTYVLGKHLGRLNDEGYTVAVYDQREGEDKKIERYLKGVYDYVIRHEGGPDEDEAIAVASVSDPAARDRRLFGLTVEKYKDAFQKRNRVETYRYIISIAFVDLGTGKVGVSEQEGESYERELQDIMLHHAPPEVILCCEGGDLLGESEALRMEEILQKTGVAGKIHRYDAISGKISTAKKLQVLGNVYETTREEDPLTALGLERYDGIAGTLTMVLDYVMKHDPVLVSKLRKPVFLDGEGGTTMRYNRDAFLELNIATICEKRRGGVDSSKQKSLLDMLSHGMNPLGRRRLEAMLRRPITDENEIEKRQMSIAYFQSVARNNNNDLHLPDLEWMLLRWRRERLSFRLVGQLLQSMTLVCAKTCEHYPEFWGEDRKTWEVFYADVTSRFDIEKMMNKEFDFIRCTSSEQEEFMSRQLSLKQQVIAIEEEYKEHFRMQQGPDGSYYLGCSVKKWESYQYTHPKNPLYEISKNKTQVRVSLEALDKTSTRMQALMSERESYVLASFRSISRELLEKHDASLMCIVQKIADMDCWIALAAFFEKHHYVRPKILQNGNGNEKIVVNDLRHALHEYLHHDILFVPYSFSLGGEEEEETTEDKPPPLGMLLYGMNSSGKSTILKSLGIAVWLAQCGLYVAAQDMEWTVRRSLYTKIGAYDNLFCNHSTFVAEMSELNYMLRRAGKYSLILCDELTSGTETSSATGIVASCLLELVSKKILFLFTTHLHTLQKIPEVRDNPRIRTCHFRVRSASEDLEASSSLLIEDIRIRYDRELRDGSGDDRYGIEIARALGMPESFINNAFAFRNRVEIFVHDDPHDAEVNVSRYNPRVVMRCCEKCGSRIHLHAHHITPQKQFHKDPKMIHNKNGAYNLAVLCERCHHAVHSNTPVVASAIAPATASVVA
jgi:DNA mismatch repair protein MutS